MDRLDSMRVFVAVAEAASFTAAARRIGQSPPAVTRAVAALEEHIGARLFHRTTRSVRLTESGALYLADCKRILGEVEEAEASAAGSHAEPRGQLGVTAPVMFGRLYVAPVLLDFLARFPAVSARMLLADRVVDLMDEGLEAAIRIAALEDSSLTAVRVGAVRRIVCASPGYLAAHGRPRTPRDLLGGRAIAFASGTGPEPWPFRVNGKAEALDPPAQLVVNSNDVAIAAGVAGRGFVRSLSYQVAAHVRAGQLEIVLAEFEPPPLPIHIAHVAGRRASARLRAFVDFAVERLRNELAEI